MEMDHADLLDASGAFDNNDYEPSVQRELLRGMPEFMKEAVQMAIEAEEDERD